VTTRPRLETERLALVPHSLDALRMQVEHGGPDDGGWFVTLADDGRVVGDCGTFGPPDEHGRVEIGYGLAAPFRGRGIGSEAVGALVGWLVTQPGVRVVTASVEVGNKASQRLLARLGFTLVGEADGHWHLARPA
jgi:RimJ/RimL family protein N-acetyltransferase